MDPRKERYAKDTNARTLGEVMGGADIFLGLSAPDVLKPEMVAKMAERPLILALANPDSEIRPELAKAVRPDAIIATGRTDYPNQVNNVLCFPFIFRGALDVGATAINEAMKLACVEALADLALAEPSDVVAAAYGDTPLTFGPDYLIPKPFDPRLILQLAPAVAKAAMESGVATRPIADFAAYRQRLSQFVFRSGLAMKPVFDRARSDPKRVVYAEGEDERVLRAVQQALDDRLAKPIIVGRREVVRRRIEKLNLRLDLSPPDGAQGRLAGFRARAGADARHRHRRADGAARRGRRPAVRRDRPVPPPPAPSRRHPGIGARRQRAGGAQRPHPAEGQLFPVRHLRRRRALGGAGGGDDAPRRRRGQAFRHRA